MDLPVGAGYSQWVAGEILEPQLNWDNDVMLESWPRGPDNFYVMWRLGIVPAAVTAAEGRGRVLEVAAAEAIHSCKMNLRGMESYVLEPSPAMLERARGHIERSGTRVQLVRGIAESLPFADGIFDRVLIDSAIDHLADPERSLAEMARVLRPDGRLVVGFVNYASLSARVSRRLYRALRGARLLSRDEHLFWDTPVPLEHTFECTPARLRRMCTPYLELDDTLGVSLGWNAPGWGALLARLPRARALALLGRLDRVARRHPEHADFVVTVWRPRPAGARAPHPAAAGNGMAVRETDVVYPGRLQTEIEFFERANLGPRIFELFQHTRAQANAAYTGDPERSWIDDLLARGPFRAAAMLGCDDGAYEQHWLDAGGSDALDIYDVSAGVLRAVRAGLGMGRGARRRRGRRVRFLRADLNFARLPEARYDVIWSSGCLHHVSNLEHLFAQVARALRPGGLFAVHDYVGERRLQFAPERLARVNAALREVPRRFRADGIEAIAAPRGDDLSAFCGVRSDDILPLARARFDVVHEGAAGALFPLFLVIDLPALEREEPALHARLLAAEEAACREPGARPCGAYVVFRKRAADAAG